MQVKVSFTEMLSQKLEVTRKQTEPKSKLHRAASHLGSGSWMWLFFPDTKPIASDKLLPASKN